MSRSSCSCRCVIGVHARCARSPPTAVRMAAFTRHLLASTPTRGAIACRWCLVCAFVFVASFFVARGTAWRDAPKTPKKAPPKIQPNRHAPRCPPFELLSSFSAPRPSPPVAVAHRPSAPSILYLHPRRPSTPAPASSPPAVARRGRAVRAARCALSAVRRPPQRLNWQYSDTTYNTQHTTPHVMSCLLFVVLHWDWDVGPLGPLLVRGGGGACGVWC
jgi:hypothetical protein